jgi:hypothetical protein
MGFFVLCMGFSCALLAGLTSTTNAVGPYLSSTTGVGSTRASTGDGIASTSTNFSGCLVSFSGSTASHRALLLRVFLLAWLSAPIFGGAIMGSGWFSLTNSSLVHPVSIHFGSACSISLQFHNGSYVAHVPPLYSQVLKLLEVACPTLINVMALYSYFCIEFYNYCQLAPLS